MVTPSANTAPIPAILRLGTKAVMSDEQGGTHAAISMAKSMLEKGLITEEEYAEIDTILLEKYRPYLGTLLSENA